MAYQSEYSGQQIDTAVGKSHLTGSVDPTTSTVGVLGQRYFNTTSAAVFECTAAITVDEITTYTWRNVIANNFTETVAGKALDATKGKALNDLISNLSAEDVGALPINGGYGDISLSNPATPIALDQFLAGLKKEYLYTQGSKATCPNLTGIPATISNDFQVTVMGAVAYGNMYYAVMTIENMTGGHVKYMGQIYNDTSFTGWVPVYTPGTITISTAAPSSVLPEGHIHMVY